MGVSHFYRHLIESFPYLSDALKVLLKEEKIFLYIDYNGMLHPCVGKVIDRYEGKTNINREKMEKEMFEEIRKHTLEIVEKIKPTFLMIAVDGSAPKAKMQQQRLRRYKSIIEKSKRRKIFDTNAISPGTPWMKKLSEYMKSFIKNELQQKCRVMFRDATIAGEGEHKIIQFIKKFKHSEKVTHIIYGLDADLIMLSMTTGLDNIYLLREKQKFEHDKEKEQKIRQKMNGTNIENIVEEDKKDKMDEIFNLLPIRKLKEYYWNDINKDYKYSRHITKKQFMNDFVFICFFGTW